MAEPNPGFTSNELHTITRNRSGCGVPMSSAVAKIEIGGSGKRSIS
jgi:hypothetical protein